MAERAQESLVSFSQERVRSIYIESLKWKKNKPKNVTPPTFVAMETSYENTPEKVVFYSIEQRKHRAQERAKSFHQAAQDPQQHIALLDKAIASQLEFRRDGSLDEDIVVTQTCALLSRLPAAPHLPEGISASIRPFTLRQEYFLNEAQSLELDQSNWHNLSAVHWFDTNTIRIALSIVEIRNTFIQDGHPGMVPVQYFQNYVDLVSELLEASFGLLLPGADEADQSFWVVAQSFLWACWYRSIMLHFHWVLAIQLTLGYNSEHNSAFNMRKPLPENTVTKSSSDVAPQYICRWALGLLRSDRACVTQDFRQFYKRFSDKHGQKSARCVIASSQPCNGQGIKHCQRFTGLKIIDQSAHDFVCDKQCRGLTWDEESYRSVEGARAVSIDDSNGNIIRYCQASCRTIAVSHVWAHGAGGRPHTGLNGCLHRRLVRLARENACDSYWMDTPCIPENHELRAEAISNINKVFTMSKMTLIWDRDIMSIDTTHTSIDLQESILCTLLVCDWNVRSWTLLEAMRARHNVHLLCKDNKLVSFKKCLLDVYDTGAIEIGNLLITSQQLLPAQKPSPSNQSPPLSIQRLRDGYVSVAESICLLAYRHASRPGDSTVIMSLLHDNVPQYTAESFWKSKVGDIIYTGLLFSFHPRLQCQGFGWAPAQPEVLTIDTGTEQSRQHLLFDGYETAAGLITEGGLSATFTTFDVPDFPLKSRVKEDVSRLAHKAITRPRGDVDQHFFRSPARRLRKQFPLHEYRHLLLLLPYWNGRIWHTTDRAYLGPSNGPLFAVVGSRDKQRERWHWLGVFEWDETAPWPNLRRDTEEIFLV